MLFLVLTRHTQCAYEYPRGIRLNINVLKKMLLNDPAFGGLAKGFARGAGLDIGNLWGASAALAASTLIDAHPGVHLFVLTDDEAAWAFCQDLAGFGCPAMALPSFEFSDEQAPMSEQEAVRMEVLQALHNRTKIHVQDEGHTENLVITASLLAFCQPVPDLQALFASQEVIRIGDDLDPQDLLRRLTDAGFLRVPLVQYPGEMSWRGGVVDIYPHTCTRPVRIECFGEKVEDIRDFDPASQLTLSKRPWCAILTKIPSQHTADKPGQTQALTDVLPDAFIWLHDPRLLVEKAKRLDQTAPIKPSVSFATFEKTANQLACARLLPEPTGKADPAIRPLLALLNDNWDKTAKRLNEIAKDHVIFFFCDNAAEKKRLVSLLDDVGFKSDAHILVSRLSEGFRLADRMVLIAYHELFGKHRIRIRPARPVQHEDPAGLVSLQKGDLVVLRTHGIGRFKGKKKLKTQSGPGEFLAIEYQDKAVVYLPVAQIEKVQKYIGPSSHPPKLSKLNGTGWRKIKARVQEAVHKVADDLLAIAAMRKSRKGFAFPVRGEWEDAFENAFPYTETPDQTRVMKEIRHDMALGRPMDRLLCGDVGYGKTELAMRAAFKAASAGKQVAMLVPTTILAQQHLHTFSRRMGDFPFFIEMLSRFRTPLQQRRVIDACKDGAVDILIGTHRILQPDVGFKDLGLVIIDEEQRFGVQHKEILKRMRATVDVLTLTATPIPRTLHMAMMGLRDISSLETPPHDRLAVTTRVAPYDEALVRNAILQEIHRDGQVFFLHNRVHNIDKLAARLAEQIPQARFVVAHGQMPAAQLSRIMQEFIQRKHDVLVCTTIIESGMDIPNVNTILINHADRFGLAQLHQLRGRVGRFLHRAHAYLLIPRSGRITPESLARLAAIEEFSQLGAGFQIALRDLEIRGAGNLLGIEQSGHIHAVGYTLYAHFLKEAILVRAAPSDSS